MRQVSVAIEAVGTKSGGGAAVLQRLVEVLGEDPRFGPITVFTSPRRKRCFDLSAPSLNEVEMPREDASYAARMTWYIRGLARACEANRPDVVLCTNGMGIVGQGIPRVVLVQQALPYSAEALACLPLRQQFRMSVVRRLTCWSLRSATAVVAQSESMAQVLAACCGLKSIPISVCVPSVSGPSRERSASISAVMATTPRDRRLLYVGSTEPYKNVHLIASAMVLLRASVPGATLFLTCDRGHPLCLREGVTGLGILDHTGITTAYDEATVVVQPSLVESGPLVPVEAMRAGRPLLVSDRPWARDACGDAAVFFDPLSDSDYVQRAAQVLLDPEMRAGLVRCAAAQLEGRKRISYEGLADLLFTAHALPRSHRLLNSP